MANPLFGNSPQQILQAISGQAVGLPEQVMINRQAGFTDYQYFPQEAVNLVSGRAKYALTYQQSLAKNCGFTGAGSIQDILMFAYNTGLTMAHVVTGTG